MAGFSTHITVSTALGLGYGTIAYSFFNLPLPTCALSAGLCSVSGMLPDVDSDSGVPLRESMAFASAVVPMLLLHRLNRLGLAPETIVLAGSAMYLAVRFGLAELIRRLTVHRGMFHSFPAAFIAAELAYLLCTGESEMQRMYKAGAVFAGFMSHLVLDEIWSVQWKGGAWRLKSSSGTAMKFFGDEAGPNLLSYAMLAGLTFMCVYEPGWARELTRQAYQGESITSLQRPWEASPAEKLRELWAQYFPDLANRVATPRGPVVDPSLDRPRGLLPYNANPQGPQQNWPQDGSGYAQPPAPYQFPPAPAPRPSGAPRDELEQYTIPLHPGSRAYGGWNPKR